MRLGKRYGKKCSYDGDMDPGVVALCDAMNALPGIRTTESCCGHGYQPFGIFFEVLPTERLEGLFFLARVTDRRYWKYGYLWRVDITCSDVMRDGHLPTTFELNSGPIMGEDAYAQADDLLKNMNAHLNHEAFIECFGLDLSKFDTC